MTDIVEKAFVTIAAFVFAFAFGWQGLHSHRMPPAQAQTDYGPDTVTEGGDELSRTQRMPEIRLPIHHRADLDARSRCA